MEPTLFLLRSSGIANYSNGKLNYKLKHHLTDRHNRRYDPENNQYLNLKEKFKTKNSSSDMRKVTHREMSNREPVGMSVNSQTLGNIYLRG